MNAYDTSTHDPIRIGYSLSLTGPVAENTKTAKLAHELWLEQINSTGGLLGRKVELICVDDYSDASRVAAIYQDLLDNQQVDLVMGGYGTNTIGAALPFVKQRNKLLIGLMGLGANNQLKYPRYFALIPTGPEPNSALTEGFFQLAAEQEPKPRTVALLTADAEFSRNPVIGAKENAAKYGLEVVHEQTYSLATESFAPIVAGLKLMNADILFLCSYLKDSIGLVRAIAASDYRPKMVGAAMIGPQMSSVKKDLGTLLHGFVNYEYWMPVPKMQFPGIEDFFTKYQERALAENADALGYYVAPLAFAQMQVLEQAVTATRSLDDDVLANYCRTHSFNTVVGEISFGEMGEWTEPRVLQTQFQQNHNFGPAGESIKQVVLTPSAYASGSLIYPYQPAKAALT